MADVQENGLESPYAEVVWHDWFARRSSPTMFALAGWRQAGATEDGGIRGAHFDYVIYDEVRCWSDGDWIPVTASTFTAPAAGWYRVTPVHAVAGEVRPGNPRPLPIDGFEYRRRRRGRKRG